MEEKFMNEALKEARKAYEKLEIPVGAVIVKNGKIISKAHNQKISRKDPTAHAEIIAIKKACRKVGSWNLNDCELYVTLKPCNMCIAVINEARIKKIYYVVDNNKNVNNNMLITKIKDYEYENAFSEKLSTFFKNKR